MYISKKTDHEQDEHSSWNNQTNTDHRCPLKRGNTQSAFTFGSQWQGFNWNPWISQSEVKSAKILRKSEDLCGFTGIIPRISE